MFPSPQFWVILATVTLPLMAMVGGLLWLLRQYAWYPYVWAPISIFLAVWSAAGISVLERASYRLGEGIPANPGGPGPIPVGPVLFLLSMALSLFLLPPVLCAPPPWRAWRKTSFQVYAMGAVVLSALIWWLSDSAAYSFFTKYHW